MSITLRQLKTAANSVWGSNPREDIAPEVVINNAGKYLYTMHPWRWRNRSAAPLDYIAPITITNGTWTNSSLTLTKTSAFTNYTFRNAELLEITDGTGATDGLYQVASRTSANAIVLGSTIGSSADAQTDIDGQIVFPYCVLPSDFGSNGVVTSVAMANNLATTAKATSLDSIRQMRYSWFGEAWSGDWWMYYALVYPSQTATSAAPAQALLEIFPTPTAVSKSPLMLSYKSGWVTLSSEDAIANVPADYEHLLEKMVKAFAYDAMNNDDSKITAVANSDTAMTLKKADGGQQVMLGKIEGGAVGQTRVHTGFPYTVTPVS